jgi:cytochrome P450
MEADELLGYQVPTGALIIMSPYVIHRLEKYWDHPDEFLPTRFSPELEGGRLRFSYIPFGGGPRLCIGSTFAAIEAHLILVLIMQRFNLDQPPGTNVQMDALVTLRPHGGMPMRLVEIPKLS